MPQRQLTAHTIVYPQVLGNVSSATINQLRANMGAGQLIRASDFDTLINAINTIAGHYHYYEDLYQNAEFGNTGDRNTYSEPNRATGYAQDWSTAVTVFGLNNDVYAGQVITASKHNTFALNTRILSQHRHPISDRYTA